MLTLVHAAPVQSVELDPDPGTTELVLKAGVGLWSDALGGLLVLSTQGSLYLVKLDGAAIRLSMMPGGVQSWAGLGYDQERHRAILVMLYGNWAPVELPSTMPLAESAADYTGAASMVALPDRALAYSGGKVFSGALGSVIGTPEATLHPGAPIGSGIIAPATAPPCARWWCVATDGWCHLYDSSTRTVLRSARLAAGWRAAGYSPRHGFFVAISGAPHTLSLYAADPVPGSISAPVFAPAPRRGALSQLSARVLGADGEPCPGHVVEFEVSAGTVMPTAAETDATGTAVVTYRAPLIAESAAIATATLDEG